tara:strand:- start:338 stop:709 length:372 start_codon:yes stop_codon:yes gene_type:complete
MATKKSNVDKKSLQKNSKYAEYDLDGDGEVSDEEMTKAQSLIDIENKDKKEDQLRQMAWLSMISMMVFTAFLFLPLIGIDRLNALAPLLQMFYVAQAGVVATFFGANAYMTSTSTTNNTSAKK